jgi:hypothetical protein
MSSSNSNSNNNNINNHNNKQGREVSLRSRVYQNLPAIETALRSLATATVTSNEGVGADDVPVEVLVEDLNSMPFDQQVQLIASSSVVIGMHGAGIAASMHMPIGTRYCCSVVEIVPNGELLAVKGYGNMARRLGMTYHRMELSENNTFPSALATKGSMIPVDVLTKTVGGIIKNLKVKASSCVLPSVVKREL